jgi:hypothetical protein
MERRKGSGLTATAPYAVTTATTPAMMRKACRTRLASPGCQAAATADYRGARRPRSRPAESLAGGIGLVGIAAAIANAVVHATGRRVRSLPITIDHLL